MSELHDAVATLAAFRDGSETPEAHAEALLERAPAAAGFNALTALDTDTLAQRLGAAFRADPDAPLAGLPLVLKDNINTARFPTTAGTRALQGHTPATDAPVAAALTSAGGVIAGKAGMHELALGITTNNPVTGAVRNPADPAMIPGGSSGGTAAAIAAGVFAAGLGTDTGGSCRIPAALCGIVGFRPSSGRYDGRGIVPISRTKDTPGPLARSVRDIALLDSVLGRGAWPLSPMPLAGAVLGIPRAPFYDDLDEAVAEAMAATLDTLSRAGARLVEVDLGEIARVNEDCGGAIAFHEIMRDLPAYLAEHAPGIAMVQLVAEIGSPDVARAMRSQTGRGAVPGAMYREALARIPQMRALYGAAFEAQGLDAIAFPTTPLTARPIGEDATVTLNGRAVPTMAAYIRNTDPGSNIGAPGISLPCPVASGLPVGIELDGLPGADDRLLALAASVERALR